MINMKLNKEKLYELYLEMKKDVYSGLDFWKRVGSLEGNDEGCEVIQSIAEGSMVSKYQIIIPDKNIDETFEVNVSECLDKDNYRTHADDLFYYRYPYFPIFPIFSSLKLNTEKLYEVYLEMKKDVYTGIEFWRKNCIGIFDEGCNIIQYIAEGSSINNFRIIIPDKNIDETFKIDMSKVIEPIFKV